MMHVKFTHGDVFFSRTFLRHSMFSFDVLNVFLFSYLFPRSRILPRMAVPVAVFADGWLISSSLWDPAQKRKGPG